MVPSPSTCSCWSTWTNPFGLARFAGIPDFPQQVLEIVFGGERIDQRGTEKKTGGKVRLHQVEASLTHDPLANLCLERIEIRPAQRRIAETHDVRVRFDCQLEVRSLADQLRKTARKVESVFHVRREQI